MVAHLIDIFQKLFLLVVEFGALCFKLLIPSVHVVEIELNFAYDLGLTLRQVRSLFNLAIVVVNATLEVPHTVDDADCVLTNRHDFLLRLIVQPFELGHLVFYSVDLLRLNNNARTTSLSFVSVKLPQLAIDFDLILVAENFLIFLLNLNMIIPQYAVEF